MPIALVALAVAGVGLNRAQGASDYDLWWHLRLGELFIKQGSLAPPTGWAPFGTERWVPTEPVPEVVAATAERFAGLDGVMWLYAVACVVVVIAVYAGNRGVSLPLAASIATLSAVIGVALDLTPRPQLVSFVLLPLLFRAWNRTATDLQPRWYLIPMAFGWSLCHGFWFIGVAYSFLEVAGIALDRRPRWAQLWPLISVAALSGAAVLLDPVGIGVFEAPFAVNDLRSWISEWQHPTPTVLSVIVVLVMQALVVVLWLLHRDLISWRRVALLVTSLFWVWYAWRTVALAGLVVSPLIAEGLDTWVRRHSPDGETAPGPGPRLETGLLAGWALACSAILLAVVPRVVALPSTDSAIDRRLDQMPAGTVVFNWFDIGGWITWRHPDLVPVIDGSITPYSPAYVDDYFHAVHDVDPGWQRFVTHSGATVAVMLQGSKFARALESDGWTPCARYLDYVLLRPPVTD